MADLQGKRILYLGPQTFGYEYEIQKELRSKGALVDYYNERVFSSAIGKILVRLAVKFLIAKLIDRHYKLILEQAKRTPYDFLFVVSPEAMPINFVTHLKLVNPKIKSVLYMWDSIVNKNNSGNLLTVFDRVLSFDARDKEINKKIKFLPLFFVRDFAPRNSDDEPSVYSVAFIGTVHSDRYRLVNEIARQIDSSGKKSYTFFYCPSKFLYLLKKIFTSEFEGISISDINFSPLTKSDVASILAVSDIVIDIEHPAQRGLTMRSIEMIGHGRKLVTTNPEILSYDFYNKSNICVVDRASPRVPIGFVSGTHQPISESILRKYSLSSWIEQVFCL